MNLLSSKTTFQTGDHSVELGMSSVGLLPEGHQPSVGVPAGETVDQQRLCLGDLKTASAGRQEQVGRTGGVGGRDRCEHLRTLVAKEPSDKQPVNHLEVTASAVRQEQVTLEVQLTKSGPQLGGQPVYLSVKEAEFPQRNSVNPNILRLEANRVCTYISATEGRGD